MKPIPDKYFFEIRFSFFSISFFFSHFFIYIWYSSAESESQKNMSQSKLFVKSFLQITPRNTLRNQNQNTRFLVGAYFSLIPTLFNQFIQTRHGRGQKRLDKVRLHLIWHSTIHTPQNQQCIELEASWLWILEEACCFVCNMTFCGRSIEYSVHSF